MNRETKLPRIAFGGDRDISVKVLDFILYSGIKPLALFVSESSNASHAEDLLRRCKFLNSDKIFYGKQFRTPSGIDILKTLNLDYIIGVHFPYIVPSVVLEIPKEGVLNLHPAYLPYNRGWHTPSWAILEDTPIGATLHFMDSGIDTGDIVHQQRQNVSHSDTANSLYQKLKLLEFQVFVEAWPQILERSLKRSQQIVKSGTTHKRNDLFSPDIQRIDIESDLTANKLIRKIRALTTNHIDEAAYFERDGKKYRIQVVIQEDSTT